MKKLKQAEVEVKKSTIERAGRGLFCTEVTGFEAEHDVCDFAGTIVLSSAFNDAFGHLRCWLLELPQFKDGSQTFQAAQ